MKRKEEPKIKIEEIIRIGIKNEEIRSRGRRNLKLKLMK